MPKITVHGGASNASVPTEPEPGQEVPSGRVTPEEHEVVPNPVEEPGEAGEAPCNGYDEMTKIELQNELDRRHLTKAGNKEELIERLREDDARKNEKDKAEDK